MATHFELSGAYKRTEKGNVNYYFGAGGTGYNTLLEAYAAIPQAVREGQHFGVWTSIEGVDKLVEYCWSVKGATADGDEVSGGFAGGGGAGIDDDYTGIDKTWSSQKITDLLFGKVDKEAGKGLSENDYTDSDKAKVDGLVQVFLGYYPDLTALQTTYPTANLGQFAIINADRYLWSGSAWVLDPDSQAGDTFATDFTVKLGGGKTFGKYLNNQTVPAAGKTAEEVILLAAIENIPATYSAPSVSISGTPPVQTFEVGQTITVALNTTFNQNDGGAAGASSIKKNGSEISTSTTTTDTITVGGSAITYQAERSYAQGPVKNDNLGNPSPAGRIEAGTVSSNILYYVGYRKAFFGPANAVPSTSADVRALPTTTLAAAGGTIVNFSTGTSSLYMVIALNPGRSIASVIDVNNANTNITSDYVLVNNNFTVNDAAGSPITGYSLYVKTLGVPYSSNTVHRVTIA